MPGLREYLESVRHLQGRLQHLGAQKGERCQMCGCEMVDSEKIGGALTPWADCGGDCTTCMANAGDPDSIHAMQQWLDFLKSFHKVEQSRTYKKGERK